MDIATLNFVLALGTVGMQVAALVLVALFFMRREPGFAGQIALIEHIALPVSLALVVISTVMTLVYSDVLGFEPCPLCWWQRIFQYPQVILLGMALWREKYRAAAIDFSIVLSVLGAGVALYHHLLQMMPKGTLPCPATGPSCAEITLLEFGYVTFPMMALSLFAFLIVTMLFVRNTR